MNEAGFYDKYRITRTDGRPIGPDDRLFVLNYSKDWAAYQALRTYTEVIRASNPVLADALVRVLLEIPVENFQAASGDG